MTCSVRKALAIVASLLFAGNACLAAAAPSVIPFDFDRGEIAFRAAIGGEPVYGLLDTGVDPSVIDLGLAKRLNLKVEKKEASGDVSGEGEGRSVTAAPATINGLVIADRRYGPIEALATDTTGLSADYGRPLQFILGYSFLKDHAVLVDYTAHTLVFLGPGEAAPVRGCGKEFREPLKLLAGQNWPLLPAFQLGAASAPVSLDTGSNSGVALYQSALSLPGVRAALKPQGSVRHGGFRGEGTVEAYRFDAPIGFGPFTLPPGEAVTLRQNVGSTDTRVANVGNEVFAGMKLRVLFDYPASQITFWGGCP